MTAPVQHDDKCDRHDDAIRDLGERIRVVEVEHNDLQREFSTLSGELWRVAERIPEDLNNKLLTIELGLGTLVKQVERQYVTREEFQSVKLEHDNVKKLVYGFVAVVLLAVITALVALVVRR